MKIRPLILENGKNGQVIPLIENSQEQARRDSICRTAWQSPAASVLRLLNYHSGSMIGVLNHFSIVVDVALKVSAAQPQSVV